MIFTDIINSEFNNVQKTVDFYTASLSRLNFQQRLKKIIFDYIDNPYKFEALPVEKNYLPSFELYKVDCTTFVINVYAFALSDNYSDFIENYRKLMYYNKYASFETRIHFTEDRICATPYFNVFKAQILMDIREKINCILNCKNDGEKLININFQKPVEISYYRFNKDSIDTINKFISENKNIIGIAFIKKKNIVNGHLITHEGFIVENVLLHSSRTEKKVCIVKDLCAYMLTAEFDGFILFDLLRKNV